MTPPAKNKFLPDRLSDRRVFPKGTRPAFDSCSGFHDNGRRIGNGMADWLKEQGATHLTVFGPPTDYGVKFTAPDAVREGIQKSLALAAGRGVNLTPGDVDQAIEELRSAGIDNP